VEKIDAISLTAAADIAGRPENVRQKIPYRLTPPITARRPSDPGVSKALVLAGKAAVIGKQFGFFERDDFERMPASRQRPQVRKDLGLAQRLHDTVVSDVKDSH
jgi:hypothetical protein